MFVLSLCLFCYFFFFQAEDGIRDLYVTGVQTCALPIWPAPAGLASRTAARAAPPCRCGPAGWTRSEERRVGKECRSRWAAYHLKKKTQWRRWMTLVHPQLLRPGRYHDTAQMNARLAITKTAADMLRLGDRRAAPLFFFFKQKTAYEIST